MAVLHVSVTSPVRVDCILFGSLRRGGTRLGISTAMQKTLVMWKSRTCEIHLDAKGALTALLHKQRNRNYVVASQPKPLLQIRVLGKLHAPDRATWSDKTKRLILVYAAVQVEVTISVKVKATHTTLEIVGVVQPEAVELVLWGPYPTTIGAIIGEVIGVVRDAEVAIGIQSLNAKTLGGFPSAENDIEPDYIADDTGLYGDLPAALNVESLFRGDTARRTPFGSVLQCYCRNRNKERTFPNWGIDAFPAPAFEDGGMVGSKIALFVCDAAKALDTIGSIEVAEGLPHPLIDGVWAKKSLRATDSYLIVDFSESTIERAIEMTRRAGLRYLYHSSPFETWGHFVLKPALFPNGVDGFKTCVMKARRKGVRVGFHTLSNFITPNDRYVTPVPDQRLAKSGKTTLVNHLSASDTEITIGDAAPFIKTTAMNTVVIGDELIQFESVILGTVSRLVGCKRGAHGTGAAPHKSGSVVAKLMDHDYKVFLTNAGLTLEVATNIASFCNAVGSLQISLDGLEGNWSTGMGQYGRTLFTQAWFDNLKPELCGQINDASNPGHFNWHIYTRMNWGEPWYAGFRESQTLYRFKNQLHYARNLMPKMLGWFALRENTTLQDAEWLLARAAGFDAGFALAASLASTAQLSAEPMSTETAKQFGSLPAILEAIHQWETARRTGAFSEGLKAELRDNQQEFHLEALSGSAWNLHRLGRGQSETPIRIQSRTKS